MKKTLMTLAALAVASVAQAATLDFTKISSLAFTEVGQTIDGLTWNGEKNYTFAFSDAKDTVILAGATTLTTSTISYNGYVVSFGSTPLLSYGNASNYVITEGLLRAGDSIDFGSNASLYYDLDSTLRMNLHGDGVVFKGEVNPWNITDDSSQWGSQTDATPRILVTSNQEIWNREGNNESFSLQFTDTFGNALTADAAPKVYNGTDKMSIGISYKVTAVPEPATATLSLLALAGLAARRRRK